MSLENGKTYLALREIRVAGGALWASKGDPLTVVHACSFNNGRDSGYHVRRLDGQELTLQSVNDIEPSPWG